METTEKEEKKPISVIIIEEKTKKALSTVEENNKEVISFIHKNMEGLVRQANELAIDINSKESYDNAIELKRVIKATHITVEKRRKELKAPFVEAGKKLDDFVKTIYTPLREAEQVVKDKCSIYEAEQLRLKEEERNKEEQLQKMVDGLTERLRDLNGFLEKINNAQTKGEVIEIEAFLEGVDLKSFGDKSSDAGFIITQLKMTCNMAKRLLPDTPPVEEEEKETVQGIHSEAREERKEVKEPEIKPIVEVKDDKMVVPKEQMELKPEQKETLDKHERIDAKGEKVEEGKHYETGFAKDMKQTLGISDEPKSEKIVPPNNGELDFSTVADENQTNILDQIEEQEKVSENDGALEFDMPKIQRFFNPEQVKEYLGSGVLPTAIYDGTNEHDVIEVLFVGSVQLKDNFNDEKTETHGLPKALTIQSVKPNGDVLIGRYIFQEKMSK